ncbi:hypothetical protein DFH09DRAFT_1418279 [Mycena vulgaris]|nr:hypothetical protein DFH09DRAFT_1418279 [Mycena vulgaris]
MPAERTRGSRRTGADGTQLVWTQPVAPAAPGIAFATNITPTTFAADADAASAFETAFQCDAPPLVESLPQPACETQAPSFFIFEPTSPPPGPKRLSYKRKAAPSPSSSASPSSPSSASAGGASTDTPTPSPSPAHIPRPPNAFILFRSSFIRARAVPARVETSHSTLSAIAGLTWAALPPADRGLWHAKAREVREEHQERFPGYAFRPRRAAPATPTSSEGEECTVRNKKKGEADPAPRRRYRDAPPPDRARCAHIASLLVQGLSGAALDDATRTFDAEREKEGGGSGMGWGVEVRFGEVVTPEMGGVESKSAGSGPARERKISTRAGVKEKTDGARERKTSSAARRTRKVKAEPSSPSSSPAPDDAPSSPATDALAPFDFSLPLPLPLEMDLSALDWPYDTSYPATPSSPFDGYDNSYPSSPLDASYESYPSTPYAQSPFSTPPASPALSHASAASPSPSALSACPSLESLGVLSTPPLSACASLEDLGAFTALSAYASFDAPAFDLPYYASAFPTYTPAFDAPGFEQCGAGMGAAVGLLPPYDLDLGLAYPEMGGEMAGWGWGWGWGWGCGDPSLAGVGGVGVYVVDLRSPAPLLDRGRRGWWRRRSGPSLIPHPPALHVDRRARAPVEATSADREIPGWDAPALSVLYPSFAVTGAGAGTGTEAYAYPASVGRSTPPTVHRRRPVVRREHGDGRGAVL